MSAPHLRIEDQRVAPENRTNGALQHSDAHYTSGPVLKGSNARSSTGGPEARYIVEDTTKRKFLTYQLAAVVSAVLAGTESQLLLFFKTSSNFIHTPAPSTLRCLLILTYTALLFSISSTISALVLTENFGDSLGIARRLRKKIKKSRVGKLISRRPTDLERWTHTATPRRWRWMGYHWLLTLVVSVLCLLMQILVYIWTQEEVIVKAVVATLGIFAVFPLLHFLPIRWKARHVMSGEVSNNLRSAEEGAIVPAHQQLEVTGPLRRVLTSPAEFTDSPVLANSRPAGEFPLGSGPGTS